MLALASLRNNNISILASKTFKLHHVILHGQKTEPEKFLFKTSKPPTTFRTARQDTKAGFTFDENNRGPRELGCYLFDTCKKCPEI